MSACSAHHSSNSNNSDVLPVSPEAKADSDSQSDRPSYDHDDDRTLKCEQLVRNPPGIEEIRRTPALGIESREIRIERTAESYRWVVYRSRGSAPDGWRVQSHLDKLKFDPALQFLLPDKKPKYIAYAPSLAETPQDSEQMMSMAGSFGQRVGTFEWNGKHYTFSVSKELPCFPLPEE
ncbi:MAG TPA: hypothetical protein VMT64_03885 [Candidatus Binataceae bacterium]|nr:hypothetical protein [Candidatus Binataceae bacterium]